MSIFDKRKQTYAVLDCINLQYFSTLLEHSIVTKSDLEGNITYINDNFTKVTGFTREDALGENHNILKHPDTLDTTFDELWKTIKAGEVYRNRVLSRKKDGSDFWAETIIIPLKDDDSNEIIEYIAIRNDITEFLHLKRTIAKAKIKEEEQQQITKAKDSFLVLFSHELKTPLNAIINFSKYLLKNIGKTPIEKQKKLLEKVVLSSTKMLEDVTQLLELSKIKSNKLTYNITPFKVCEILDKVIQEHESLAQEHHIKITKHYSCQKCGMQSDVYRFKQIISNVLSNAIKYSKSKVHVELNCCEKYWSVHIEDDGNGIKDKEKVFELFEQNEDDITTREKEGTGIGLSFVKLLCKDLGFTYLLEDSKKLGGLNFQLKAEYDTNTNSR